MIAPLEPFTGGQEVAAVEAGLGHVDSLTDVGAVKEPGGRAGLLEEGLRRNDNGEERKEEEAGAVSRGSRGAQS